MTGYIAPVGRSRSKSGDTVMALLEQSDSGLGGPVREFAAQVSGPDRARSSATTCWASSARGWPWWLPPTASRGACSGCGSTRPSSGIVAEVKDGKSFATTPRPAYRVRQPRARSRRRGGARRRPAKRAKPGTEFAEFRRLKGPEQGYVLAVPPSVLPTPAGLRPTIIVRPQNGADRASGPRPHRPGVRLGSLVLNGRQAEPASDRDRGGLAQSDPSGTLPALLVNLPSLVQFIGFAVRQQAADRLATRARGRPPFRLQLDPDTIPEAERSCGRTCSRRSSRWLPTTPRSGCQPTRHSPCHVPSSTRGWRRPC